MTKYFAIKHIPSGDFLPEYTGRGYTSCEPCSNVPPRLFTTQGGAKCALTWWLQGRTSVLRTRDYFGEYDETWHTESEAHRKPADMKIVPMSLQEAT